MWSKYQLAKYSSVLHVVFPQVKELTVIINVSSNSSLIALGSNVAIK